MAAIRADNLLVIGIGDLINGDDFIIPFHMVSWVHKICRNGGRGTGTIIRLYLVDGNTVDLSFPTSDQEIAERNFSELTTALVNWHSQNDDDNQLHGT